MNKVCEVCNISFHVKPSHFEKRHCCSKKCQNINQKKKIGRLNSNWKNAVQPKNCKQCKKDFISKNPYIKTKFCSHKCSSDFNIGKPRSMSAAFIALVEIRKKARSVKKERVLVVPTISMCECGNKKGKKAKVCMECKLREAAEKRICSCGNKKEGDAPRCNSCWVKSLQDNKKYIPCACCHSKMHLRYQKRKYCSKDCYQKHRSIINKGENNPNWRGGVMSKHAKIRASENYIGWRLSVFKRDKFTCQHCGQVGHTLHAHHIKPFATHPELRTEITNGITLCEKCHKKVHTGVRRPKTIDK